MKKNLAFVALATFFWMLMAAPAWSQTTAHIEGKITDGGKPVPNAQIVMTNVANNRKYKVKADKSGTFAMLGVEFGQYSIQVNDANGQTLATLQKAISPSADGGPVQVALDVSQGPPGSQSSGQSQPQGGTQSQSNQSQGQITTGGQQSQPKYTKEQVEEMQKQNEKAKNENALINQLQDSMKAQNWTAALPLAQQLVAADPNNWQFYQALGNIDLKLEQYDQAADAYAKGIQAAEAMPVDSKNPASDPARKKAGEAAMLTNQGNAFLKLKKNNEAVEAFTKAASMDPNPAVAYFNLCATQYNTGNVDGALQACDKAIAADPTKADAYFIKGSLLVGESKVDASGKMTAPPGASEALNKYLELQPEGQHAADVKQMLQAIGSKVETTYKKGKGK
jgi:tetratricopeptide (TPR) repeat protein